MIIGNVIKFFIKLAIGLFIGAVLFIMVIMALADGTRSYFRDLEPDYKNASKIVQVHQDVEKAEVGTVCICAICMKEKGTTIGAEFTKKYAGMNSCSQEHEREYQEIYRAYETSQRNDEVLNSYGVKSK